MRSLAVMVSNGPLCSQGLRAVACASTYAWPLPGRWRICWMPSVARIQTQTVAVKGPRSWKKVQLIRGARAARGDKALKYPEKFNEEFLGVLV